MSPSTAPVSRIEPATDEQLVEMVKRYLPPRRGRRIPGVRAPRARRGRDHLHEAASTGCRRTSDRSDVASRQLLFRTFYRLGFTPWDGHPLPNSLANLIEGDANAPSPAKALDIGCGTGDNSIYLAEPRLAGHRRRLRAEGRRQGAGEGGRQGRRRPVRAGRCHPAVRGEHRIRLLADRRQRLSARDERRGPPRLRAGGDGGGRARRAAPAGRVHPRRLARRSGYRTFARSRSGSRRAWTLLSSGSEPAMDHNGKDPGRFYLFQRAS